MKLWHNCFLVSLDSTYLNKQVQSFWKIIFNEIQIVHCFYQPAFNLPGFKRHSKNEVHSLRLNYRMPQPPSSGKYFIGFSSKLSTKNLFYFLNFQYFMMPTGTVLQFLPIQPPWMLAQIYPDSSICSELPTKDFLIGKILI